MTTDLGPRQSKAITDALNVLADPATSVDDRAAVYAYLHQVQLRINRALRKSKDELIVHMESNGLRDMGPLSVKATAFDVEWPVNAEDNWADLTVQEELAMFAQIAPDYIRHVPDHFEIRTAELGAGVHASDPVAVELHKHAKERRWRTEGGRRLSLAVKEARAA